jgi:thiamine biosynthesis lipoprotein
VPTRDAPHLAAAHRFAAIGTAWQIDTETPLPDRLRSRIGELCEDFDRVWSRFRADSLVQEIARAPGGGRFRIPTRDVALLDLYELLGYDSGYSLRPDRAGLEGRVADRWSRDVCRDGTMLVTERPVVIDVGAAGKGHLVDLLAALLLGNGITTFVVDGSGDLRHRGPEPFVVGLEHPTLSGRVLGTVPLQDGALCASATTRRAWGEDLHHVLDGRTGRPATDVVATWAMAIDAATADALATALFVADPKDLGSFGVSWVRMLTDGRVQWSGDFAGELFL